MLVNVPNLISTLNLWLHLSALILWIGGIFFFLFVFGPAVHNLSAAAAIPTLDQGRRSLETLSWIAINFLVLTGVLNFILRGLSSGFELGAGYYGILALKLLLFLAMLFHHSLQAFKYGPQIADLTARAGAHLGSWPQPLLLHWRKYFVLLKINATLGPIVLLLGLGLAGI